MHGAPETNNKALGVSGEVAIIIGKVDEMKEYRAQTAKDPVSTVVVRMETWPTADTSRTRRLDKQSHNGKLIEIQDVLSTMRIRPKKLRRVCEMKQYR